MGDFHEVVICLVQVGLSEPYTDGDSVAALELLMSPPPGGKVFALLVKNMSRRW